MPKRFVPFIDRLNERGWVDRMGFLAFGAAGAAGIVLGKWLGVSPILVAVGSAAFMLLYACLVEWSGTGRLRSDQAGDNCYYLGLIYTLVSLAYAIFTFDPVGTATTIVQGFGIALTTTILGLILRVYFNQTRVDLIETEDTVRLELTEAAGELKTQLSQIIIQMNDFSHQTRQSLTELRSAIAEDLEGVAAKVRSAGEQASQSIEAQATETTSRMKRLATATEKVAANLESHGESLKSIEAASRDMATSAGAISQVATGTREALDELARQVQHLAGLHETLQSSGRGLGETVSSLQNTLSAFDASATQLDSNLVERLEQFKQAPIEGLTEAAGAISEAVARVGQELDRLVALQAQAADRIADQSSAALQTASRHNEALEAELTRSRTKVEQVHGALVEMTGELVRQVEAPNS